MWSINDLPEKTEKCNFSGGGYFFCFDVTANGILHRGSSKHYIMQEKSLRDPASFSNCALLHINQSSVRNKRKELGGEKSWKPLVYLRSVNRPLDSEDQTSCIGHWRWSLLQVGLRMKNASMRKEISIKQGVAFDLKTSLTHFLYCTILLSSLCKQAHLWLKHFTNLLKSGIYSYRIDWFKDIPEV